MKEELAFSQAAAGGVNLNIRTAEDQVAVQQTSLGRCGFLESLKIKQNLASNKKIRTSFQAMSSLLHVTLLLRKLYLNSRHFIITFSASA